MPGDWKRAIIALAATVLTVAVVLVLYWARVVFIPVTLSIFLTFVLSPLVSRLQRRGFRRSFAVVLTVGSVLLATIAIGTVVAQQISNLANTIPDQKELIKQKIVVAKHWLVGDGNSRFAQLVEEVWSLLFPKSANEMVVVESTSATVASRLDAIASPAMAFLGQAAFVFVLTVFMLLKKEDLRNRMIWLLGDGKVTRTTLAVNDASKRISRYLVVQLLINTGFGVVITLGLFALGLDYALLWGLIATVMRYVPYIGTFLGMAPAVLFSIATAPPWGSGWGQPLAVLALFLCLEAIANNVFEPWLFGRSMGLSEVAQLIAAAFWFFLWGPIGLILSGPMTACLLVLGKHVERFRFLEVLLGDRPALSPEIAYYQRLAARDRHEAEEVTRKVALEQGVQVMLDTVVVPALGVARRDYDEGELEDAHFRHVVRDSREIVRNSQEPGAVRPDAPDDERVKILIAPTRDEAEHVAAEALAAVLDPDRWQSLVVSSDMLASELVAAASDFQPDVIVLVALPPGGITHCRYLMNRLRTLEPRPTLIIGRWDRERARERPSITVSGSDGVDHSLLETRKRLTELRPVLASRGRIKSKHRATHIGTASA